MKSAAHRATDDLGVPEVNRARQRQRGPDPERGRRADDRAHVAGVLKGVEHEHVAGARQTFRRPAGYFRQRQDALRRVGIGRARELGLAHLQQGEAQRTHPGTQREAPRILRGRAQHAADRQAAVEQRLDRAGTFRHEEAQALAGLPALEVTGEREQLHGSSGHDEVVRPGPCGTNRGAEVLGIRNDSPDRSPRLRRRR